MWLKLYEYEEINQKETFLVYKVAKLYCIQLLVVDYYLATVNTHWLQKVITVLKYRPIVMLMFDVMCEHTTCYPKNWLDATKKILVMQIKKKWKLSLSRIQRKESRAWRKKYCVSRLKSISTLLKHDTLICMSNLSTLTKYWI